MRPPPPKKNDYCFFFLSQGEVESFHSSHVWPVSMLLLCRLECVGRKSFADYKMCVSDSMLWLCLILVCFFLQIFTALFLSFICSLCLHLSCSLFLFFLILPSCLWVSPLFFAHHLFSKSFFSPSCFLISSGVLVHTPLLLVSLRCLLLLFFYCQLFYFLLFLFFASFTFSLLSSVVFFHFSFILFSFLFLICFPFTFVPSFLPSHPWPLYSLLISLFPLSSFPHFPSSSLLIVSSSSPFHLPPASSPVFFSSSPLHLLVLVYPEAQSQKLLSSVGWWGCGVTSTFLYFFGRVSRNRGGSHRRPVYMYGWVANLMLYTYLFKHVRAAQ